MPMKLLLTSAFAALAFAAAPAQAQDVVIEGDAAVVEERPVIENDVIVTEERASPRVYGWTLRPDDCGTFHYWNGERCADARTDPPVTE